jgi:hypothetical protein
MGAVEEHVSQPVDAGPHGAPRGAGGGGVGNRQSAVAVRFLHGRVEDLVADHRQAGVADHGAVLDHDLDVVAALRDLPLDHPHRLLRCGAERELEGGQVRLVAARLVGGVSLDVISFRRAVLARVPTGRGDPHQGGAQVCDVVPARNGPALRRRPATHHLELGRHAEAQRQAKTLESGMAVRVDQAGQERPAAGVDDRGAGRH